MRKEDGWSDKVLKVLVVSAIAVLFAYFGGHAIGEGIAYLIK